ncbi:hypothetical protein SNEBB_003760 [Seison nebaliae]|nr:hypothetical protein SNEBB_003760 [Seison nebaliae]
MTSKRITTATSILSRKNNGIDDFDVEKATADVEIDELNNSVFNKEMQELVLHTLDELYREESKKMIEALQESRRDLLNTAEEIKEDIREYRDDDLEDNDFEEDMDPYAFGKKEKKELFNGEKDAVKKYLLKRDRRRKADAMKDNRDMGNDDEEKVTQKITGVNQRMNHVQIQQQEKLKRLMEQKKQEQDLEGRAKEVLNNAQQDQESKLLEKQQQQSIIQQRISSMKARNTSAKKEDPIPEVDC